MLAWIKRQFSATLYVQLWQERLRVVNIATGKKYDQRPYIGVSYGDTLSSTVANKKSAAELKITVHEVGDAAYERRGDARLSITNPFLHPRLLVKNFGLAEKVLQHAIKTVCQRRFIVLSPLVVIQPMEKLEGGVTDVESRLYRELALGAGARVVYLHVGDELNIQHFNVSAIQAPNTD